MYLNDKTKSCHLRLDDDLYNNLVRIQKGLNSVNLNKSLSDVIRMILKSYFEDENENAN